MGLRVTSVAMAVPPRVQTAEELAPLIDRSPDWIREHTGVSRRHVATDDVSPAQLAATAAREALAATEPPDLLLYAGAVIQQLVPDTSTFVARELNLVGTPSFCVNQTCLSFLTALQVAHGLLMTRSYRRILICSAELATRGRSFREPESAALMGDGAAAAVVEWSDEPDSDLLCRLETWTDGIDLCYVRAGSHPPPPPDVPHEAFYAFHMHGPSLYRFVRPRLKRFLEQFLADVGCAAADVPLVIPHQASGPGLRLLEQCGFDEARIVKIVSDYGNCVAASIPMTLAIAARSGRLTRGQRVLLVGTAAGVSLGAAWLRW